MDPTPNRPDGHPLRRVPDPDALLGDDPPRRPAPPAVRLVAAAGAAVALTVLLTLLVTGEGNAVAALAAGAGVVLGGYLVERRLRVRLADLRATTGLDLVEGAEDTEDLVERLVRAVDARTRSEREAFVGVITSLASALEARDPFTRDHSRRVASLCVRIGRQLGYDAETLYELHLAGLLHDIGKIGIADAILQKPAGLTLEEFEIMKGHADVGARILAGIPGLETVARMVHEHHEMIDGRGYPRGLRGEQIHPGARIVAVADTWISMVEDRPYRPGRSQEKARAEMLRVSGKQLDAGMVEALFAVIGTERPEALAEAA